MLTRISRTIVLPSHSSVKYALQELMLFVSQFPCGLIKRFSGDEPVDKETGANIMRKPGRGVAKDGEILYVRRENCLSKLKRWLATYGIQGKSLHERLGVRSKVTQIAIGDCEPELELDYVNHLKSFEQQLSSSKWPPKFDLVNIRNDEFVFKSENKQPQPVALIYWADPFNQASKPNIEQVVDGRRKGLTKRQCQSDRPEWRLKSGDHLLRLDLDRACEPDIGPA